jgi:hypothetical protein
MGGKQEWSMNAEHKSYVTFGVQAGGKEADAAVEPAYMRLRKLLAEKCARGYGPGLIDFGFVLRIDGNVWHWEKRGCANLRVTKKGDATIDIFMPTSIWKGESYENIRDFLAVQTREGFALMLQKAIKKGIEFDHQSLLNDFESALALYESSKSSK